MISAPSTADRLAVIALASALGRRPCVEPDYPGRLARSLGPAALPVLFGAGDRTLLASGGIAIVGSRDAGEARLAFARDLAAAAARGEVAVISGAAKGVDENAMRSALEFGGRAVGVVADHLDRRIREPSARQPLADGRLVLTTPYSPAAGFSVRTAMGRNKVIYGLADIAVVVASAYREGGTWSGAIEAIGLGATPVFIPDVEDDDALAALRERGARELPFSSVPEVLKSHAIGGWWRCPQAHRSKPPCSGGQNGCNRRRADAGRSSRLTARRSSSADGLVAAYSPSEWDAGRHPS